MKKKLEAELISIAHRILKLKNKSDLNQLHQETQKLYEKLSVLKFVEENFAEVKPTIGQAEIEDKIEAAFEPQQAIETAPEVQPEESKETEEPAVAEVETKEEAPTAELETVTENPEVQEEEVAEESQEETATTTEETTQEEIPQEVQDEIEASSESYTEEITASHSHEETQEVQEENEPAEAEEPVKAEDSNFKPAFELSFDTKDEEIAEQIKEEIKNVSPQITFDDLLGANYADPVFVKPEDLEKEKQESKNVIPIGRSYNDSAPVISLNKDQEDKTISLNDRLSKGIIIGLNDRIAFMNHLFANSSEDYNRVLSQLMTFDTFADAKNFIDTMVKPDYNNWEGKDEYAERFMEIVEKKFS